MTSGKIWACLTAGLATVIGLGATSTAQAQLLNGGFESEQQAGPSRVPIENLTNWTATGGFMLLEQGPNATSGIEAFEGTQFVSMGHNNSFGDLLEQIIDTTPGETYSVTFQAAGIQALATQEVVLRAIDLDVSRGGNVLDEATTTIVDRNIWQAGEAISFVATTEQTILQFEHTVGNVIANLAIDDVQVVVPEPAGLALAGAAATLLMRRRR